MMLSFFLLCFFILYDFWNVVARIDWKILNLGVAVPFDKSTKRSLCKYNVDHLKFKES